jgi:glycosyltransferase involved in cell wall biosynthesis
MSTTEAPLVTIITPVYNGERYLRSCIESVLAQTWERWEYVIVNNRSTDGTLAIAEGYAARDRRIRVVTNASFVGVIANHNLALEQVSPDAKYVKFVHADDWLYPECVEKMVGVAEAHRTVGLVGAYRLKNSHVELGGLEYPSERVPGRWLARVSLLGRLWVFGSPTSTMLRADVARNLDPLYNEHNLHADTEACYRVLQDWDFGFVHQILTFTRAHTGTVTSSVAPLNTHIAGNMSIFLKYGPRFLTPDEYSARFAVLVSNYYEFLGRRAVALPGEAFWQYHREQLERFGIPLGYRHLLPYMVGEAFQVLRSPSRTVKALRYRYGYRTQASVSSL